jgi:hypothetical protein
MKVRADVVRAVEVDPVEVIARPGSEVFRDSAQFGYVVRAGGEDYYFIGPLMDGVKFTQVDSIFFPEFTR